MVFVSYSVEVPSRSELVTRNSIYILLLPNNYLDFYKFEYKFFEYCKECKWKMLNYIIHTFLRFNFFW